MAGSAAALAESPEPDVPLAALAVLDTLGAEPLARLVRSRLGNRWRSWAPVPERRYRYPFAQPHALVVSYPFWAGLPDEQRSATGSYAFWLLGLPAAFAVIAAWYRHRAHRMGVRVPWPVLVAAGIGVLVLVLVLVAIPRQPVADPDLLTAVRPPAWHGLATPLLAVAAAVVALGWVERPPGLAATGVWIGMLAWWQCAAGVLGATPGWLTWLLTGGSGPAMAGQLGLRPAGMLLAMVGPLLVWVIVQAVRSRGGSTR